MVAYVLLLLEDKYGPEAAFPGSLASRPRVLFSDRGRVTVRSGGADASLEGGQAWFGVDECMARAGSEGARVLRYELVKGEGGSGSRSGAGVESRVLLEQAIELNPSAQYLMRCDRVEFDPGGEALPHGHRGGGIRCLLQGRLDVKVADGPFRTMRPGDAWFESGKEPVHAVASKDEPTSFIRVSILPRELQGKSSIVYVDQGTAARSRPRRYTVFVDDPIEI
jgi:quercetin dioxygenase-like cupin family protein